MNDYEALLHQAERLEALQEIRNLMGRYSYPAFGIQKQRIRRIVGQKRR